jgi:hypothetical protein
VGPCLQRQEGRLEGWGRQLDLLAEQVTERSSRAGLDA